MAKKKSLDQLVSAIANAEPAKRGRKKGSKNSKKSTSGVCASDMKPALRVVEEFSKLRRKVLSASGLTMSAAAPKAVKRRK